MSTPIPLASCLEAIDPQTRDCRTLQKIGEANDGGAALRPDHEMTEQFGRIEFLISGSPDETDAFASGSA
jgi:hypothetical protein